MHLNRIGAVMLVLTFLLASQAGAGQIYSASDVKFDNPVCTDFAPTAFELSGPLESGGTPPLPVLRIYTPEESARLNGDLQRKAPSPTPEPGTFTMTLLAIVALRRVTYGGSGSA